MNLHALTGAYVLDALDPDELAAFEAHLPGCPDCRAEVASLREAAARMAVAEAVAPPPELREAVRARIARTPQLPPLATPEPSAAAPEPGGPIAESPAAAPAPAPAASVTPLARPSRAARLRHWPTAAVAASVALLLAMGAMVLAQSQRDSVNAQVQAEVVRIMSAPDMVSHDLGLGSSHLVMSDGLDAAAVMGSDVPMPAKPGMVYQVWMMHADGSMAPGPTFLPHDGHVTAVVRGDLSAVAAIMVTEEPKGGSPEPTGQYVAELHL
jgi:anti-sigma factor RsiW